MSNARSTSPRRWRDIALAGAAASVAAGAPALAQGSIKTVQPGMSAQIWTVQAEGGEGGEAGAVAETSPDVAYLSRLAIVEGHMVAAVELYRKGLVDEAVGLSGHPEAEMMDEVREDLAKHQAADFSPLMEALGAKLAEGAAQADVDTALAELHTAIEAAMLEGDKGNRDAFDTLITIMRGASVEYADSIEDGVVTDQITYHEAWGFTEVARDLAQGMTTVEDPVAAAAAAKVVTALNDAAAAFADPARPDATLLPSVAARIELVTYSVK